MSDSLRTVTQKAARGPRQGPIRGVLHVVYPPEMSTALEPLVLANSRVVVGRQPADGGHRLEHPTVSRNHLAIEWSAARGTHVVTDLGSHNGSRVDGRDLAADQPLPLQTGWVLQFGDVVAVYERAAEADGERVDRETIPGRSAAMCALRAGIERVAADPAPVLVTGETGTGKESVARELHRLSGRRGNLVTINCAALSPQLIESQLFGHVRGAFTGATGDQPGVFRSAHGGTLQLDEIGELPLDLQPKLLRVIQDGEIQPVGSAATATVDVRVIASTNRKLPDEVASGAFRRDLYARLAMWELEVPALRRRRADILDWVERLHARWRRARPKAPPTPPEFGAESAARIVLFPWLDNLRGVDRLIHALADRAGPIPADKLPAWLGDEDGPHSAESASAVKAKPPTREEFLAAYEQLEGNVSALARRFNRDRRQIYRWIDGYGLR